MGVTADDVPDVRTVEHTPDESDETCLVMYDCNNEHAWIQSSYYFTTRDAVGPSYYPDGEP